MKNKERTSRKFADLRNRAQVLLSGSAENGSNSYPEEVRSLVHELDTYQIELELQNSELRRVQEQLTQSRNRFSDLYDFAPAGYLTITATGVIVETNVTAATMLGVERLSLVGKLFSRFIAEADQDIYYHNNRKLIQADKPQTCELRLRKQDGDLVNIILKSVIDLGLEGRRGQVRVVMTDISERIKLEEELRKSSDKIQKFAYAIVHDIKSPAVALNGLCGRLRKRCAGGLDEQCSNYCDLIFKNSEHIAGLVDKINLFVQTKENPLDIEKINFREITNAVTDEFWEQLTRRQVEVALPDQTVELMADRLCIIRLIRNFMDNSLKYGGKSLSKITISYQDTGDFHTISFNDDGTGVKPEHLKAIFGMFKRQPPTSDVEGAGLGLAIVKEIVEQHKGKVWGEKGHPKGITFFVSLAKKIE